MSVIGRGQEWGEDCVVPEDATVALSDARVAALLDGPTPVVVGGGDLHRSLGSPAPKSQGMPARRVTIDVLECTVVSSAGSAVRHSVSNVRVGSWFSPGGMLLVSNCGFWRRLDAVPRAHPNDGRLHVLRIEPRVPLRQLWMARRRARSGSHVPHQRITTSSAVTFEARRSGRQVLFCDDERVRDWQSITVRVLPGAASVLY